MLRISNECKMCEMGAISVQDDLHAARVPGVREGARHLLLRVPTSRVGPGLGLGCVGAAVVAAHARADGRRRASF